MSGIKQPTDSEIARAYEADIKARWERLQDARANHRRLVRLYGRQHRYTENALSAKHTLTLDLIDVLNIRKIARRMSQ